ncbi:MAG: Rnase Y domain-containing protein, partial [Patescibacteria group bacterium]
MEQFILLIVGVLALVAGAILGYFARQSIAKRDLRTAESKLQQKTQKTKEEVENLLKEAKEKSNQIIEASQKEADKRREDLRRTEHILLERENLLNERLADYDKKEAEFNDRVEKLKVIKESLERQQKEVQTKLEKIAGISKEEAKNELLKSLEKENQEDLLIRMRKLEREGSEALEKKAQELLTLAIQRCALSHTQESTSTTLSLPSEEIKGRIIGKEGRNIKTFERLTGVEVMLDETPETVTLSSFDPVRRQI